MNEYDNNQMLAVEEFAKGIRECYLSKMNDGDKLNQIFMTYALQILDIHLSLAQIKFDRYSFNLEKTYAK